MFCTFFNYLNQIKKEDFLDANICLVGYWFVWGCRDTLQYLHLDGNCIFNSYSAHIFWKAQGSMAHSRRYVTNLF